MTKNKKTLFLDFLDHSPTAWHAVQNCLSKLLKCGYEELNEGNPWRLTAGKSYFVTRNGSSLIAFTLPKKKPALLSIAASHTDSPAFKLKPNAEFSKENMILLGVEVYGAPLLSSWLNRDLGIAGRILILDEKGKSSEKLVRLEECPLVIPQLAIHLDREVNEKGLILNKQEHLAAIAATLTKKTKEPYLETILKKAVRFKELLAYDLFLFPLERARFIGNHEELIASYRIDNLAAVFACLHGILENPPSSDQINMAVFWDSEETGSGTMQGAGSPFLWQVIERIALALDMPEEAIFQWTHKSLSVSVDLGHAMHPSYPEKHEPRHAALLNEGVIIKYNAQNRYASDARSSAKMIELCKKHKIPFQKYVSRGDIPCGSTVGPIHAAKTGMSTVDVGIPQLSMHSCRELMGTKDLESLCRLLSALFAS